MSELMQYELPSNWSLTKLGEICEVNPRIDYSYTNPDLPVTFVPMAAVDADSGTITSPQVMSFEEARKGHTKFKENDVIFARITPCMENGKISIARNLKNGLGFGSTEFHVFRPKDGILSEYVYYFVRQESFRNFAASHMTSTVGQLRVPRQIVEEADFPLAPLEEQKRIVSKIEELFRESRTSRHELDKIPIIMKRFRQSVLASAFGGKLVPQDPNDESAEKLLGRLKNQRKNSETKYKEFDSTDLTGLPDLSKGWTWTKLGELIVSMKNGIYKPAKYYGKGTPCLRMYNIEDGKIVWKNIKEMILEDSEIEEYGLNENDILLNRVNSRELVGKAAVIPAKLGKLVFESKNIRIRVWTDFVIPSYITRFLQTRFSRDQIEMECKQTVGMATVSQQDVENWLIPLPPVSEQKRIMEKIDELFTFENEIEKSVEEAKKRADKIDQSILVKAFRGELIPQDPNDEPASVLLEKIKNEKQKIS